MSVNAKTTSFLTAYFDYLKTGVGINSVIDSVRFAIGEKQLLKLDASENCDLPDTLSVLGFYVMESSVFAVQREGGWLDTYLSQAEIPEPDLGDEKAFNYWVIGRDPESVSALQQAEDSDSVKTGYLLGYPDCCVQKWAKKSPVNSWVMELIEMSLISEKLNFLSNRIVSEIGYISPIGEMFPCSLNCSNAAVIGESGMSALRQLGLYKMAEMVKTSASRPLYITNAGVVSHQPIASQKYQLFFE